MTRVGEEEFEGKEVSRIYIAESVREAKAVESALDREGVAYLIDIEQFQRHSFITSPTAKGLAFYVLCGQADHCRDLLRRTGLAAGLMDD